MENLISCCVSDCSYNCNKTNSCQAKSVSINCCGSTCSKTSSETMCSTFKPKQ